MSRVGLFSEGEFASASWVAGALTGIGIVLLVLLIQKLSGKTRRTFDERQIAARGVAYKWGFFSMMIYETAYSLLLALGIRFADGTTGPFLGIFVGVTVFGAVAAAKDAYTPLNEMPHSRWLWPVLSALWLFIGVMRILDGKAVRDGLLTLDSLQLFLGASIAVISTVDLIHNRSVRELEREDE